MNGPGLGPRPKFAPGPGPGPGPAQILAWVQARTHSFDMKCLSIIFNFLNRKGPHTKPPCVKPPFNNNRQTIANDRPQVEVCVCVCVKTVSVYIYIYMGVSRLFRCWVLIPGPLCKRGSMGPKGPTGPWGQWAPWAPRAPWGPWAHGPQGALWVPWGPVYVAFTQRCWGKGTNEKCLYIYIYIYICFCLLYMFSTEQERLPQVKMLYEQLAARERQVA